VQVRSAIKNGALHLDALKNGLRVGQGPCQGRTCGPLLARMIAEETRSALSEAGTFHVRPPVKPVPLGILSQEVARDPAS
jgi:bacterioferritin-associated ferredoxin